MLERKVRMAVPSTWQDALALPAIVAPMFLTSGPDLVVEVCRSGLVGTFPALNQRSSGGFESVHPYGGLVFHDVISRRHAEKAAEAGVDGIIAVCAGAGGHAGILSPFALVEEIREFFSGTIVLSGAVSSGAHVAAARMMGA